MRKLLIIFGTLVLLAMLALPASAQNFTIKSYSPSTEVTDYEGASRTFTLTLNNSTVVNQMVWYLDGSVVKTDNLVNTSSYIQNNSGSYI